MADLPPDSPVDRLWKEYGTAFRDFDDLSLARWCAQTLSQINGHTWRMSHPLIGCYRLAAQQAHDRQIWLKRLVNMPAGYAPANCCRAPLLPLFTRDAAECGLICQHCGATAIPFEELPAAIRKVILDWSARYEPVHDVAHWDDARRKKARNYDQAFESAAQKAEGLLADASRQIVPLLLDLYPAALWEDQDECLEVRPEDITTWAD